MRQSHLAAFIGCAFLIPYSILLCGGRSPLADRVAALEAEVASINTVLSDHEQRIAVLEGGGVRLVVLDTTGAVVGEVVPGTATDVGARISRSSGQYEVPESGFSRSRSLIFRDPSCAGPHFTVDLDWPSEHGALFFPVERPIVNLDLKARVRADASIADEEGLSTVQLFIPNETGGCQAWSMFDASTVFRLIERDDLSIFVPPFMIVESQ